MRQRFVATHGPGMSWPEDLGLSTCKGTHMWLCTTRVHIQKRVCDKIYVYLWIHSCTSRGSKCEHSQGHTYVTLHNMGSSTNVSAIWYMYTYYTCEYMHVYQEVLSVSTRKGINICELFQHGFIYKRICDMIFVYLWVYASISRGSKCEHSQEHKHMWAWTTPVHIRTYLQ